jgi:glycosyltransferase involved in cell wall biosynthesis
MPGGAESVPGLAVVVITKNEEHNIRQCLESVRWAEERIVVDSESTDRTVAIARECSARIFTRPFTDYADQRNFGDRQASCPWVLALDADERVPPGLKAEIAEALARDGANGYWIPTLDYMFGRAVRHGGWYPQRHLRLYRKSAGQWRGKAHEEMVLDGRAGYLANPLLHFSHLTISHFVQKLDRYTSIEGRTLHAQGKGRAVLNMLFWPPVVFVYKYIYRAGFMDGVRGLVLAVSLSYYWFIKYAKLWEEESGQRMTNAGSNESGGDRE